MGDPIEMPDGTVRHTGALRPSPAVTAEQLTQLKGALDKRGFTRPAVIFDGQYLALSVAAADMDRLIEILDPPNREA